MTNKLSDIFDKEQTQKNALIGRLLTPQEIEVVAGGGNDLPSTSCGQGGSSHSQGGGTYNQGPSGSYGQGGSGGGSYNQTC